MAGPPRFRSSTTRTAPLSAEISTSLPSTTTGRTWRTPSGPRLVGTDRSGVQDSLGVNYTRVQGLLAQQGGGFVFYRYPNPAHNMTPESKMSYVAPVDDTWYVGAGIY